MFFTLPLKEGEKEKDLTVLRVVFRSIFAKNASVVVTIGKSLNLSMKHCCGLAWLVRGKWDSREKCDSRYQCFCLNPLKMLQHAPNVVTLFAATSMMTVIHLKLFFWNILHCTQVKCHCVAGWCIFRQQWSSMPQRNKLYQALTTHWILVWIN